MISYLTCTDCSGCPRSLYPFAQSVLAEIMWWIVVLLANVLAAKIHV
jgi:hypothetical protein